MFSIETSNLQSMYLSERAAMLQRSRSLRRKRPGDTDWEMLWGPCTGPPGLRRPSCHRGGWRGLRGPSRPPPRGEQPGTVPQCHASPPASGAGSRSALHRAQVSGAPSWEGRPERALNRCAAVRRAAEPGPQREGGRRRGFAPCACCDSCCAGGRQPLPAPSLFPKL